MTNSVTNLANDGGSGGLSSGLFPSPSALSADGGGGGSGNAASTRRSKSLRRGELEGGGVVRAPPPLGFRDNRFT